MIRGTTPTEVYTIGESSLDLSQCTQIWVTIVDYSCKEFTWDIDRLTVDSANNTISLTLTQLETLEFTPGGAYAQSRFLYSDGSAFASKRVSFAIEDVKKGGVITNE